ncbi:DUF2892 domain-containing protein [Companilactobacillus mishanensis]|uniref:DUF2892 domain-containing protein n=1 Tax=Companilactobacillus mishanensis TaxID=2486008 RepID=A0A5P0ZJL2_9LACO|nr:DUF2892 domain-containing protein [Companilactobacillus mishanensis]MQS45042.1 DUF2892 domain-containing protein [Companilactobacillus mishanensis]MQS53232.1 DUF2892 domain-containing protein [Companilactobacillus mishanensis]MQS90285.1 DUF2892 domain-containing protein [Companilactobacillus mishanensis]
MVESRKISNNKDFSSSLVTPWIKGNIFVDDNFLRVDMQNTVLFGLIPAGRNKDTSPLNTVSNVSTSSEYKLGRIFLGALLMLTSFALMGQSFFMFLFVLLVGIAIGGSGILTVFAYERSGVEKRVYLPFFEANHSRELEEQVIAALTKYQDDRSVAAGAASITEAIRAQNK